MFRMIYLENEMEMGKVDAALPFLRLSDRCDTYVAHNSQILAANAICCASLYVSLSYRMNFFLMKKRWKSGGYSWYMHK